MSKGDFVKVYIKDFTFDAIIGILDFEREKPQTVIVNCTFKYNYSNGIYIDYSQVAQDIKTMMEIQKFGLLEDALSFIKEELKKRYEIRKLKLKIAKPDIIKNCCVEVEVEV